MQDVILTYFNAEKATGLLLIALGVLGAVAAGIFFQPRWELRPFALTLAFFALAEIAIGLGLYIRTGPQVNNLVALLGSDAGRFVTDEGQRMSRIQKNFIIIQYVELALIVVAAVVAVTQKHRPWVFGIALGVLLNAALLLAVDLVAERRGAVYLKAIESQTNPAIESEL